MSTVNEIAQKLKDLKENIILIYAFNATGKTRLSVEYKNITKKPDDGKHIGVYYNAFSEDLFVWDNDNDNGEQNIKLDIKFSSLNRLHSLMTEEDVEKKLIPYKRKYNFFFDPNRDFEKDGFASVTFYKLEDTESKTSIKISRGEERIFVWCFFLALLEIDGWANTQNAHFFIDDPVSSLDDHNIFVTAYTVFDLIEKEFEKRKILITSHHFGFLTILSDMLGKGEKSSKFRNRDNSKKYKEFILEGNSEDLSLIKTKDGVFLYHLRLLQILNQAADSKEVYIYHFALLRQVLENIASFLGVGQFSYVLEQIGITDQDRVAFIVNALSHLNVYYQQIDKPVPDNLEIFNEVLSRIMDKYRFIIPKD
ncbi:AAA family ATPase [Sphingobacterium humi]|uniref:AAA family ATPase n=1 Tax=Sphingobacterium humi TaxID=1796905 RepID=A0A6N8KWW9_9SPHI|nr:AAA family ATPase [Sphingobacterium humi]MVZ61963.1 AAA family ATPase [Sphingobacterium humi]